MEVYQNVYIYAIGKMNNNVRAGGGSYSLNISKTMRRTRVGAL